MLFVYPAPCGPKRGAVGGSPGWGMRAVVKLRLCLVTLPLRTPQVPLLPHAGGGLVPWPHGRLRLHVPFRGCPHDRILSRALKLKAAVPLVQPVLAGERQSRSLQLRMYLPYIADSAPDVNASSSMLYTKYYRAMCRGAGWRGWGLSPACPLSGETGAMTGSVWRLGVDKKGRSLVGPEAIVWP